MSLIKQLREKRATVQTQIDALVADVEKRGDAELTADEASKFSELRRQLIGTTDAEGAVVDEGLDARIDALADVEARKAAAARAAKDSGVDQVIVRSEPLTYGKNNGQSYFLDLARAETGRGDAAGARERLARHAKEMDVEMPAREARRAQRAAAEMDQLAASERRAAGFENPFERRTNPNRTDGQGGNFVPPLWLIDEYVPLLRAGRVFANSVRNMTLPSGTDSINLPKVATGTAVAAQNDGGSVQSTDMTDTSVSAAVKTIAGQQDIALQLLEQSPIAFDEVVFTDLIADYNQKLDAACLNGTPFTGIKGLSDANAITYTDASPTGPELFAPLAQAASQLATNRLMPPTAYFFHTRRWYWLASQLDANNRPLVQPLANGPYNVEALQTGVAAEGPVGQVLGIPILMDPNISITNGAGTNEDRIYAARTSDIYLWEGSLRSRTLMEVLSGTLQVRLQVYNYAAFMPNRYPVSVSEISGTGLAAPSGF